MYPINVKIISKNNPHTPFVPRGIVLHETATNNDTDEGERNYFNNNNVSASAHAFIDNDSITQCIDFGQIAWHAGATANKQFIGIELCHTTNPAKFAEIWKRGVWLFAWLFVNKIGCRVITKDNLMSHAEVSAKWHETDHTDPVSYFAMYRKTVDDFRRDVQSMINEMTKPAAPPAPHWAEPHYEYLISQGFDIKEKRFDDKISRGELFKLFAILVGKIQK